MCRDPDLPFIPAFLLPFISVAPALVRYSLVRDKISVDKNLPRTYTSSLFEE